MEKNGQFKIEIMMHTFNDITIFRKCKNVVWNYQILSKQSADVNYNPKVQDDIYTK